jgi:hypothetical protein
MNTLDASMKICKFFNLAGLQERISKLREARELEDELGDPSGLGKRKSKYAHLEDYEIMTDSRSSSKRKAGPSAFSVFQQPFEELPSAAMTNARAGGRMFNQADVFKAPAPSRRADQVAAQEEEEEDDDHDGGERCRELRDPIELSSTLEVSTDALMLDPDDDLASLNSSVKRPKLSEYSLNSQSQSTVRECKSHPIWPLPNYH